MINSLSLLLGGVGWTADGVEERGGWEFFTLVRGLQAFEPGAKFCGEVAFECETSTSASPYQPSTIFSLAYVHRFGLLLSVLMSPPRPHSPLRMVRCQIMHTPQPQVVAVSVSFR